MGVVADQWSLGYCRVVEHAHTLSWQRVVFSMFTFRALPLRDAHSVGVWFLGGINSTVFAPWLLLSIAVVWGLWIAMVETRTPISTFQLSPVAWHPVLAAALVSLPWQLVAFKGFYHFSVIALLALCAVILYVHDRFNAQRKYTCCRSSASLPSILTPSAMGLMMGTLWLGNDMCTRLDWSAGQMQAVHLAMMACLPSLIALLGSRWKLRQINDAQYAHVNLSLMAMGSLMLWGDLMAHGFLGMLLLSLSWALHCSRRRTQNALVSAERPWVSRGYTLLLGPILLLWVGLESVGQDPLILRSGLTLLGALAAAQLLRLLLLSKNTKQRFSAP